MDVREVIEQCTTILRPGVTREAEEMLVKALTESSGAFDCQDRYLLLSQLIFACSLADPPKWGEVEKLCEERETVWPRAESMLQTGMMFFWSQEDYERAIPKLREAIELGRKQNHEYDSTVIYQALSTLGHAFVKLGRKSEAVEVLSDVERMVPGQVVVGDETGFLEALLEQSVALDRVAKLAAILAPLVRDDEFRERLTSVARQASSRASTGDS